jgi:uncharacterized protein
MLRYDDLRIDAGSLREYPDGSIRVTGQLTHPGIFTYRNPDGTPRREYRPAEEVFRKDALETFASTTVTMNHPRQPNGQRKVTSDSWKKDAVGHMGENIREDAGHAVGDIFIRDAAAIRAVKDGGVKYLSCGYDVDYDPTPGVTPDGQRYDGLQRNIRGNHVALLPNGVAPRGGSECVLRLDAQGNEEEFRSDVVDAAKLSKMTPEQVEALNAQITALTGELAKARTDAAEVTSLRANLATATTDLAVLTAQIAPERLDSLVEERASVVAVAKAAGIDCAGKSTLAVKRLLVAKNTPGLAERVDSMSVETIDAVMSVYAAQPHPSLKAVVEVAARADALPAKKNVVTEAYAKSVEASRNAWKNSGDAVPVRN